ncbi:uncharacterized protein LOC115212789 [Octopus sinensis]|uniref:Uncharacterized protein LOC115212789 n=1 Tax=Octopus sinensis TaxID=2607531 RepID=A0A6P7SG07_9MOLL|nr:uncharacterized protein LOC115212789 [Octopus sinensis]
MLEVVSPILISEIENALNLMKTDKESGKYGITPVMLRCRGEELWKILVISSNRYLKEGKIPTLWKESNTILLHMKGDKKICRTICVYKLFTKVIATILSKHLDDQQSKEQAGFRKNDGSCIHSNTAHRMSDRIQASSVYLFC